MTPGRYQLRIGAHNAAQGKAGSVYYDLEVPDFSKGRVALSGLVLSATPVHPMATPDRLASLLPVVPTTLRAFTTLTRVEVFVRIYQNDKAPSPVALATSVTNAEGGVVFEATRRSPRTGSWDGPPTTASNSPSHAWRRAPTC